MNALVRTGEMDLLTSITQGEIANVIYDEYGMLAQAAIDSHIAYKTLNERKRVVRFYGIGQSAAQNLIDNSLMRALHNDYPTLSWTHYREAAKLRDFEDAVENLLQAVDEAMTPKQFTRHIAKLRKKNGEKPPRIVITNNTGKLKTIIVRE